METVPNDLAQTIVKSTRWRIESLYMRSSCRSHIPQKQHRKSSGQRSIGNHYTAVMKAKLKSIPDIYLNATRQQTKFPSPEFVLLLCSKMELKVKGDIVDQRISCRTLFSKYFDLFLV
jgi:hypothetical protein